MFDVKIPLIAALALAVSIAAPAGASAGKAKASQYDGCDAADSRAAQVTVSQLRSATLCLINIERRAAGRGALRNNSPLRDVATRYSRQMVSDGFFDHVSPGGSTMTSRVRKSNYLKGARAWALGENIAWGEGSRATPREIVESWMDSPGHRANILSARFKDIGIGIAQGTPAGSDDGLTYTTDFGRRG